MTLCAADEHVLNFMLINYVVEKIYSKNPKLVKNKLKKMNAVKQNVKQFYLNLAKNTQCRILQI